MDNSNSKSGSAATAERMVLDRAGAPCHSRTGTNDSAAPQVGSVPAPVGRAAADKPGGWKLLLGMAALLALAGVGYGWWLHARTWVVTDNAYVSGHIHQVSARVSGTVQEVLVEDNQEVRAGDVIARLDPRDLEVKRQQAHAQVAQAHAQVLQGGALAEQAAAEVARREAQAGKARRDLERARALAPNTGGVISRQELDAAQSEADAAEAALQAAQSALVSAKAQQVAATAQEAAAKANEQEAELQLSYVEIRAPADGKVSKKSLEMGNRIQAGQALLALVQPDVWVTANFKETQLARLRAGQTAQVWVDAYPGRPVAGVVDSFAAASGSQFALLPPDNATGNFTRIVQRVPVKVRLNQDELRAAGVWLVPGMSTEVRIRARS